jgi:hypothetical protein
LGVKVRISHIKGAFSKEYQANWTPEVFIITQVDHTEPNTYRLCDLQQEPLEGSFYEQELQKTSIPEFALVEEILETRKQNGNVEKLVQWLGYPKKFNSCEPANNIRDL